MHLPTLAAALLTAPLLAAAGMYGEPVIELDARSFKKVMAKEHVSMVAFVAPWCGHCKNLAPEYTGAAKSLHPLIPFYAVDCDQAGNKALCAEQGIKGFPTLKGFPKASKGPAKDYNGERARNALIDYAMELVPQRVKKLRADEDKPSVVVDRFLSEKPELSHALLVSPTLVKIPWLWKVLGHRLTGKVKFGFIKDTKSFEFLYELSIDGGRNGAPRMLFWPRGGDAKDVVVYEDELKFNRLLDWLEAADEGVFLSVGEEAPKKSGTPKEKEKKAAKEKEKKAAAKETDDEAAKKAKAQAKLDEAERRDRLRREKLAAQKAAEEEDEARGGTPVEEPAAEPAGVAEEGEEAVETPEAEHEHEHEHAGRQKEEYEDREGGTPVDDAPPAEPAEAVEEAAGVQRDEL